MSDKGYFNEDAHVSHEIYTKQWILVFFNNKLSQYKPVMIIVCGCEVP